MKTCPICGSRAFDDAATCYGCMHPFGEEPAQVLPGPSAQPMGKHASVRRDDAPPSFLITLRPPAAMARGGDWTCSVELVGA